MKNTLDIQALWRAMTLAATQLITTNTYPSKDEPEADRLSILKNKVVRPYSMEEKEACFTP